LFGFALLPAVNGVPILAGGNGHAGDSEVLVQLVVVSGDAAPASHGYSSAHFHGLVKEGAVKQPVDERDKPAVGGGKVHRAGNHQAVGCLKLGGRLVDQVVKDAFALLLAGETCNAAANVLVAYLNGFHLHAFLGEDL